MKAKYVTEQDVERLIDKLGLDPDVPGATNEEVIAAAVTSVFCASQRDALEDAMAILSNVQHGTEHEKTINMLQSILNRY